MANAKSGAVAAEISDIERMVNRTCGKSKNRKGKRTITPTAAPAATIAP